MEAGADPVFQKKASQRKGESGGQKQGVKICSVQSSGTREWQGILGSRVCNCLEHPMAHLSGFQAMGISIGAVEAILTIQIGGPSPIFALYLHVDNVNPNILSLLIESKGT